MRDRHILDKIYGLVWTKDTKHFTPSNRFVLFLCLMATKQESFIFVRKIGKINLFKLNK